MLVTASASFAIPVPQPDPPTPDRAATAPTFGPTSRYFPDVMASLRNPVLQDIEAHSLPDHYGNRVNVTDWLSTGSQHLVVGVPGSGKSALLRTVVLDVFADTPSFVGQVDRLHSMLPIWLPFAFWTHAARRNANSVSVIDAIRDWLNAYDHGHLWSLIERALGDERALLVVDGLDEWASPDLARMCIDRLEVFASTKSASVIASSRPFSTADLPVDESRWRLGTLAPLNHQQRFSFVSKWLAPVIAEPVRRCGLRCSR